MSPIAPRALRLPLWVVATRDGLAQYVARTLNPHRADLARIVHAYAFKCDERSFARELLARRTQLWLYRTHQAVSGGDFVVVDRSAAEPDRVWVIELKRGRPVHVGGAWQLRQAELVVDELVGRGEVAPDTGFTRVVGDAVALLGWFAKPSRPSPATLGR